MFTGLIQSLCQVKSINRSADSMRLTVELRSLADNTIIGDSIAVNGVCLTVASINGQAAAFDVSAETLSKTNLGKLTPDSTVNVETALKPTDRLGGHFVLGHIDGVATIAAIEKKGRFANIKVKADPDLLEQMVPKGSVAVDGISLTIADIDTDSFTVALIPETLNKTTLGQVKLSDTVNIETDIIVKAIKKQLENILPKQEKLTVERLKELGF